MSKSSKNIEDLFRSNFENYKVEPSIDAWNKIDSKLSGYGFNNYFKNIFNSHRVVPSSNLWPKIARKVWFANFIKYQPLTFNVYNVASVTTCVIILFASFNLDEVSNILNKDKQLLVDNTTDISPINNDFLSEVNNDNYNSVKKINTIHTNEFSFFKKRILKKSSKTEESNILLNESQNPSTIKNNYIIDNQKTSLLKHAPVKKEDKSSLIVKNTNVSKKVKQSNSKAKSDTVGVNAFGKPIIMEREKWSYDVYTALGNSQSIYGTNKEEFKKTLENVESKQSQLLSYSVGLNVNYEYYGFTLQGGLSYSQLGNSFKNLSLKDSIFLSLNQFNSFADSTGFINNDSLSFNDTISSILLAYHKLDSLSIMGGDTSLTKKISSKIRYRYFEFPLTLSYSVKQNNFTFGVTGGLITGLFINVSGENNNKNKPENNTDELKKENPYAVPNFSSYLGLYMGYEINKNSQLFLEPYYRKSLNSIYTKESYFTQKFTAYGARVGLRYSF